MPRRFAVVLGVLALVALPRPGRAQGEAPIGDEVAPPSPAPRRSFGPTAPTTPVEAPPEPEDAVLADGRTRTLRRHVFIFPSLFDSSMIATYFGVRARVSLTSVPGVPTDFGRFDVATTTVAESLDFGVRITDWLGLYGNAGGRALTGTNVKSLIYVGATYNYFGALGAQLRLLRSERTGTQLTVRAGALLGKGQVASVFPLFASLQSNVTLEDVAQTPVGEAIRTPVRNVAGGGTLNFAQAISPMFGVQATAGLGVSSLALNPYDLSRGARVERASTELTMRAGAALSASFDTIGVPIAVMAEYVLLREYTSDFQQSLDLDTAHRFGLGVYYAGRRNLDIGVSGAGHFGMAPIENRSGTSERPRAGSAELILRYVW